MNNVKRKIICAISAMAVGATMLFSAFAVNVENDSSDSGVVRENLTAMEVSKEMGLGINLGNTMEAYWLDNNKQYSGAQTIGNNTTLDYETCWGAVETTQEIIDGMKDAGFNTVRIPVYWGNMMNSDGTFTINDEYIARVKEIVDYCMNDDLYAVINIHHFDEFIIRRNSVEECDKIFTTLWTQIAEYFKDYGDKLVFEGYNEYLGGNQFNENGELTSISTELGYEFTNTLNQTFVDAVRATGGNNSERVLIVSGYTTNIDMTTADSFVMPTDTATDKLMVSVHYVDNYMYWINRIGNSAWEKYSIDQCELLKSAFTDKGIPVFVGECTAIYTNDRFASNATVTSSSEALDYMLRLINSYGFTPVLWDTNNNFYSRTNCQIIDSKNAEVIKALSAEISGDSSAVPPTDPEENLSSIIDETESSPLDSVADVPVEVNSGSASDESSVSDQTVESKPDSLAVTATVSNSSVDSSTSATADNTSASPSVSGSASSKASTQQGTAVSGDSDSNANTGAVGAFSIVIIASAGATAFVASKRKK